MTLIILWIIALIGIVILNAKFWKICPDMEDREAEDAKARNIAPVMPQTPIPYSHKVWYVVDMILLIVVSGLVVWLICNYI